MNTHLADDICQENVMKLHVTQSTTPVSLSLTLVFITSC